MSCLVIIDAMPPMIHVSGTFEMDGISSRLPYYARLTLQWNYRWRNLLTCSGDCKLHILSQTVEGRRPARVVLGCRQDVTSDQALVTGGGERHDNRTPLHMKSKLTKLYILKYGTKCLRNNKFINYSWPRNRHDFLVQKSINKPNQATIRNPEPTSDRTNLFGSHQTT